MKKPILTADEFQKLVIATADLPFLSYTRGKTDYVIDVMQTVLDFHMQAPVVNDALDYFREHVQSQHGIDTHAKLQAVLDKFADTVDGNTEASRLLWNNAHWTRIELLRRLLTFLASINVTDQPALHVWANQADFERDFKGKVKGLGVAVYQWLLIRCGVSTIKPDIWVINFAKRVIGRKLSEANLVEVFTNISPLVGEQLDAIDITIWHFEKMAMATTDVPAMRVVYWYKLRQQLEQQLKDALPGVTWTLSLDPKSLLRYTQAGLVMTPSDSLFDGVPGVTRLSVRQSLWPQGLALELKVIHDSPLPTLMFDQLKAKLEDLDWEVQNDPAFEAALDLDTDLLMPPENTLADLADWVDEGAEWVLETIALLHAFQQADGIDATEIELEPAGNSVSTDL